MYSKVEALDTIGIAYLLKICLLVSVVDLNMYSNFVFNRQIV